MNFADLKIRACDFERYEWQDVLLDMPVVRFNEYYIRFFKKAAELEAAADQSGRDLFTFLGAVSSFEINWDNAQEPFLSREVLYTMRSFGIRDIQDDQIEILRELVPKTSNARLCAHFADVLNTIKFDYRLAAIASEKYLEVSKSSAPDGWTYFIPLLERSIELAARTGKNQQAFGNAISEVKSMLDRFQTADSGFCCSKLVELLLEYNESDPNTLDPLTVSLAKRGEGNKRFNVARKYWRLSSALRRKLKDVDGARESDVKAAETHYREGDDILKKQSNLHLAAAHHFSIAYNELRQAGADKTRITEVHRELLEAQKIGLSTMGTFSVPFDYSDLAKEATGMVEGRSLEDAIRRFAFVVSLENFEKSKKDVADSAEKYLFLSMMPVSVVDSEGRVTGSRGSLWNEQSEGYAAAILSEVFKRASSIHWPFQVVAIINPAANKIWKEHAPTIADLRFIVEGNPTIPTGHELSLLRGIQAGFSGDFQLAAYLLLPQFEPLIRHVLKSSGVIVSSLDNRLIQDVKTFGQLLFLPETIGIFGSDLVYTMRGLLTEDFGSNLRNRISHGLLSDLECHSAAVVYSWWLLLNICLRPVISVKPE